MTMTLQRESPLPSGRGAQSRVGERGRRQPDTLLLPVNTIREQARSYEKHLNNVEATVHWVPAFAHCCPARLMLLTADPDAG